MGLFFENQRKSNQAIRDKVKQQKTRYRVGGIKRAIGEQVIGGKSDRRVSVVEQAILEQGIGERVIGERANLGESDRGVIEINNTVRNE